MPPVEGYGSSTAGLGYHQWRSQSRLLDLLGMYRQDPAIPAETVIRAAIVDRADLQLTQRRGAHDTRLYRHVEVGISKGFYGIGL